MLWQSPPIWANKLTCRVSRYIAAHGFLLTLKKTVLVVLTKKRINTDQVGMEYLGRKIYSRMSSFDQIRSAAGKNDSGMYAVDQLHFVLTMIAFNLHYGSEVLAGAFSKKYYCECQAHVSKSTVLMTALEQVVG